MIKRLVPIERNIELVREEAGADPAGQPRIAGDRGDLPRTTTFVRRRILIIHTERERRVVIKKKRRDVIIVYRQ